MQWQQKKSPDIVAYFKMKNVEGIKSFFIFSLSKAEQRAERTTSYFAFDQAVAKLKCRRITGRSF